MVAVELKATSMSDSTRGWLNGLTGVVLFSASLPATRIAVMALDPWFVTSARTLIAAILSLIALTLTRQVWPKRSDFVALLVVTGGVVIGFPLLTGLALKQVSSAHANIFIGLLPLSTAIFGVLRGGERPSVRFWAFAVAGSAAVGIFAVTQGGHATMAGDAMMLLAIVVCGLGYAEGARLARTLGGWQVISWALLIAAPLALAGTIAFRPDDMAAVPLPALAGLAYVGIVSMWLGFVFWYRGLLLGGIARVGQLQLLQSFLTLVVAALLLKEDVSPGMVVAAAVVVGCVWGARRSR